MTKKKTIFEREFLVFFVVLFLTLFNTVNLQQNTVLFMSIPQYVLVFFFLIQRKFSIAFLLHAVFVVACVSKGIVIEEGVSPFLYTQMRVYGPITFDLIVLVTLWLSVRGRAIPVSKDSLLLKTRNTFFYLLVLASVIGLIGCLFIKFYDWKFWLSRILFVGEVYLFIDIFLHLYSEWLSKLFALVALCMIAAAPVASFLSYSVFGVFAYYGYDIIPLYNPIFTLTPCLIIAIFQLDNNKLRVISLIGLVFYVLHSLILSRGSQFLDVFVALVLLAYLVYFKKSNSSQLKSLKLLLPVIIIGVVPFAIGAFTSGSDVSMRKFEQFTSLFTLFGSSGGGLTLSMDELGSSPYIRVAELANIISEGLHNILALVFGNGFGGYYTDELGLFTGLDLSGGAFSYDAALQYGRFYNAHSAIPNVLHYNGLIGLFLMLRLAFFYLRRVDRTFLVFAAFVLFVQNFYFDMFGCLSFIMALFGAEYALNSSKESTL